MVNTHINVLQSTWGLVAEEPLWGELLTAYAGFRDCIKSAVCRQVFILDIEMGNLLYCFKKAVNHSEVLLLLLLCLVCKCIFHQVSVFHQV